MLQSIRDRTHGWIAGVIISILILSFALWGIHSYFEGTAGSETVASVNGVAITSGQLSLAYDRMRRQVQLQTGAASLSVDQESLLRKRALEGQVFMQVLKQAAVSQGYRVSNAQVDGFLESMPELQVNGQFSPDRFQQLLSTMAFTAPDFIELIRTSLVTEQPRLGIIFSSFALPNEVDGTAAIQAQKRGIQYAVLPLSIVETGITISNQQVKEYYEQHQDEFKTPEQVSINYIVLSTADIANTIQPTDDELKKYYDENANSFTQPMQYKLQEILIPLSLISNDKDEAAAKTQIDAIAKQIKAGADFATLAKQHPAAKTANAWDPKITPMDTWIDLTQVADPLKKDVAKLNKVGQVTDPIKTPEGLVLIKLVDLKQPTTVPFDAAKAKVKETLVHQKAEEQFADVREKLISLTYEHPESLDQASKALNLPVQTSGLFSIKQGGKDITANQNIRDAAFSNDVLNSQNNSDAIQLTPESVAIIRVKEHNPASVMPLASVQQSIIDKLKTNEADARTAKLADEIKEKLQTGSTQAQIAQLYHITWNTVGLTDRQSTQVNPLIVGAAFHLPKPVDLTKLAYTTVKVPEGYAIVTTNAVQDGAIGSKDQYNAISEQIQNTTGLLEFELYKQSLMKQAKIVTSGNIEVGTSSSDS